MKQLEESAHRTHGNLEQTHFEAFNANLLLLVLSSMLFYSSAYVLLNFLPRFVTSLGGSPTDIGLATAAFVLSGLLLRPFVGRFIDRFGRKSVLIAGCLVFAFIPLLYSLPDSVLGLIGVRALHGIGLSLFSTAGLTLVVDITHKSRWGEATGFFLSAQIIAISIAPGLGSIIAEQGSLLALLPYAVLMGAVSLLAASRVQVSYDQQTAQSTAIDHLEIINKRGVSAALVAAVTVGLGYAMVITFMPVVSKQYGMKDASLYYFIYAMIALIVRTPAGRLSDRVGRRAIIVPMVLLSSLSLLIVGIGWFPGALILSAFLYGIGFGSAYPVIGALAADNSAVDSRGIAMSLYAGGFDVGLLIGSALGGVVNGLSNSKIMFVAISILMFVGVLIFSLIVPRKAQTGTGLTHLGESK